MSLGIMLLCVFPSSNASLPAFSRCSLSRLSPSYHLLRSAPSRQRHSRIDCNMVENRPPCLFLACEMDGRMCGKNNDGAVGMKFMTDPPMDVRIRNP
jgi:hypothetical protein